MFSSGDSEKDKIFEILERYSLHPLDRPVGDEHHTDVDFNDEDKEIATIARYLGALFVDKESENINIPYKDTYFYREMTSLDVWMRVARALRIHGLAIRDRHDIEPACDVTPEMVAAGVEALEIFGDSLLPEFLVEKVLQAALRAMTSRK